MSVISSPNTFEMLARLISSMMSTNRSAMIVGPLAGRFVIIRAGDLADRAEVRIPFRHNDDVALAHAAAESPDLGDIAADTLGAGLDLIPLVEDRLVVLVPGIGPVDLAAPSEHDVAALDSGIV